MCGLVPLSTGLVPLLSCGLGSDGKKIKVHVGVGSFLCTVMSVDPSGLCEIRTSRKAHFPSDSTSRVN